MLIRNLLPTDVVINLFINMAFKVFAIVNIVVNVGDKMVITNTQQLIYIASKILCISLRQMILPERI
jgi:hypothetical protein